MSKKLFASSIFMIIAGWGIKLLPAPVKAELPPTNSSILSRSTRIIPTKQPQLELLSTGTEPRHKLRFRPAVNAKETTTLTISMDILAMSMNGKPSPSYKLPAITMTMETVVTKIEPNGDIDYEFSYSNADLVADPTTSPLMLVEMRSQIKKLVGLHGSGIVSNLGQMKAYNLILPEGFDQNTKQMIEQMSNSTEQISASVPEQAIGIGAKWRVTSFPDRGGINLAQVATYQLVTRSNHLATIDINLKQQATAQNLTKPELISGSKSTLKSINSQGQGQITMDLNRLIGISSNMSVRSDIQNNVKYANQDLTVDTQLLMRMAIKSK